MYCVQVLAAMEMQKGQPPSIILDGKEGGTGELLLGGYNNVIKLPKSVKYVLNTAKGLDMFGPKYTTKIEKHIKRGIIFLNLNWVDALGQNILEDLPRAVRFIHSALQAGDSILVHCAQGKSRSTSAVMAYLLCIMPEVCTDFEHTLEFVKQRRLMAQPNSDFERQLRLWGRSEECVALREELNTVSQAQALI